MKFCFPETEKEMNQYLEDLKKIVLRHHQAFKAYLCQNWTEFDKQVKHINSLREEMDLLDHHLQITVPHHLLKPDSPIDLLCLLYFLNHICDEVEYSIDELQLRKPEIPISLHSELGHLLQKTVLTTKALVQAIRSAYEDPFWTKSYAAEVIQQQSEFMMVYYQLFKEIDHEKMVSERRQLLLYSMIQQISNMTNPAKEIAESLWMFTETTELDEKI